MRSHKDVTNFRNPLLFDDESCVQFFLPADTEQWFFSESGAHRLMSFRDSGLGHFRTRLQCYSPKNSKYNLNTHLFKLLLKKIYN